MEFYLIHSKTSKYHNIFLMIFLYILQIFISDNFVIKNYPYVYFRVLLNLKRNLYYKFNYLFYNNKKNNLMPIKTYF